MKLHVTRFPRKVDFFSLLKLKQVCDGMISDHHGEGFSLSSCSYCDIWQCLVFISQFISSDFEVYFSCHSLVYALAGLEHGHGVAGAPFQQEHQRRHRHWNSRYFTALPFPFSFLRIHALDSSRCQLMRN